MRLMDCLRLRILDVDFDYSQIVVREAKVRKIALFLYQNV